MSQPRWADGARRDAGAAVDVVVLGPVGLRAGDEFVAPASQSMRTLLGLLAVAPGRELSADALADRLWRDRAPSSTSALPVAVHRLRRWLADTAGDAVAIGRTTTGYRLELSTGDTDAARFAALVTEAGHQEPAAAVPLFEQALALWRNRPLADLGDGFADETAVADLLRRRDEARLALGRALLTTGQADRAVRLLESPVREETLDEALHAVYVEALAASGDRVGALNTYEQLRLRLADELGVDPSTALQQAYLRILHHEVRSAVPAAAPAAVSQLPADARGFTGREDVLRRLDKLLNEARAENVPLVAVVSGMPGVGKTCLAVRWAHQVEDEFPDGRLYLNLRGHSPGTQPLSAGDALARLLRSLGTPSGDIPTGEDAAAAEFRSRAAGRRLLLVLDNARSAEQVRPLLPGSASCCTVVTSRGRLGGLVARDGAQRIALDALGHTDAERLLTTLLGDRAHREAAATRELAELCGRLPLALRIAAANLDDGPGFPIAQQVDRIRQGDVLGSLAVSGDPDATVRAAFDLSFDALSEPARHLFRLLGLVPGTDIGLPAIAALTGGPPRRALDELVAAHLVEPQPGDRFVLHDLLRHYARERRPDDGAALRRLTGWYLAHTDAAVRQLDPHWVRLPVPDQGFPAEFDDGQAGALSWLDTERGNIVATVQHTTAQGPRDLGRALANAMTGYLHLRTHTFEGYAVAAAELAAAEAGPAPAAERAAASLDLARVCERLSHYEDAIKHSKTAAALAEEANWPAAQSVALAVLGVVLGQIGRIDTAIEQGKRAWRISHEHGLAAVEGWQLNDLGIAHLWLGRLDEAEKTFARARDIHRSTGSRTGENLSLIALGQVAMEAGRLDDAINHLAAASELLRREGRILGWPRVFNTLAAVHVEAGRFGDAIEACRTALPVAEHNADRVVRSSLLNNLGDAYLGLGRHQDCADAHRQALALAKQTGLVRHQGGALLGLARCARLSGDLATARVRAGQALQLEQAGRRIWREGQALTELAWCEFAGGEHEAAVTHAEKAVSLHHGAGHRLAEERAQEAVDRFRAG